MRRTPLRGLATRNLIAPLLLTATVALGSTGCSDETKSLNPDELAKRVKIGMLVPFSGSLSSWGRGAMNAALLAVDEINKAGGIVGEKPDGLPNEKADQLIQLVVEDTLTDPKTAVDKARAMISDGCVGFVGPVGASVALQVFTDVADLDDAPLIIIGTGPPSGLSDQDLLWRIIPDDKLQGKEGAKLARREFLAAHPDAKDFTVGIVLVDNKNGADLVETFKAEIETPTTATGDPDTAAPKGKVVFEQKYADMLPDVLNAYTFKDEAKVVADNKPDVLYLASASRDGAKLTVALGDVIKGDYRPLLVGSGFMYGEFFRANANASVIEGMVGTVPGPKGDDQYYNNFKKDYKALTGIEAQSYAEAAYDAVYLLSLAMEKAQSTRKSVFLKYANLLEPSIGGTIDGVDDTEVVPGVEGWKKAKELLAAGTRVDYRGASGGIDWVRGGFVGVGNYGLWRVERKDGALTLEIFDNVEFDTTKK